MTILKCNNCGTEVPVEKNEQTTICKNCGLEISAHVSSTENSEVENKLISKFADESSDGKIENGSHPNVDALIERGYFFLTEGEFDQAYQKFDKALDCDAKLHKAYWGILLAEHQCKDETELTQQGVCLDTEPNYKSACQYSDEETKTKKYEYTAKLSIRTSHIIIVEMIRNKMYRPAKLRADNYASSEYRDERLCTIHQTLLKKDAFSAFSQEVPDALLLLLKIYKEDDLFSSIDKTAKLSEKIANDYKSYMYRLRAKIISEETKKEDLLTLAEIWSNPCKTSSSEFIGLDSHSSSVGERWLFLAELLLKDPVFISNYSFSEIIFRIYDKALEAGADISKVSVERQEFYNLVLNGSKDIKTVDYLISKDPNNWRAYWHGVEIYQQMDSPDYFQIDDKDVKAFFKTSHSEYKQDKGESIVESKKNMIQLLEDYQREKRTQTEKYLSGAIEYAGANAEELREKWNAYIADIDKRCTEKTHTLNQHLSRVYAFMAKHDRVAARKGIISSFFSVIILAIPVLVALFAWQNIRFPERLMTYSTFWYTVLTSVVCLVGGIILTSFQKRLKKVAKNEHNHITLTRVITSVCSILSLVISVAAAAIFVFSGVKFNSAIGTISISKPEEMAYLNLHPGAEFILTEDIDLSEADWKAVSNLFGFSGTLDGQGHSVINAISNKPYFISKNSGTIKNISFINAGTTDKEFYLIKENKGTLSEIVVDGVHFASNISASEQTQVFENSLEIKVNMFPSEYSFYGIVYENDGEIADSQVVNINGRYIDFSGIAYQNHDNAIISECTVSEININLSGKFAGAIFENNGNIDKCKVKNFNADDVKITFGGGLVGTSYGRVSNCCVDGLKISGSLEGCFGGLVAESYANIINCSTDGLVASTGECTSSTNNMPWFIFGGIVGEQLSGDICNSFSTLSMSTNYSSSEFTRAIYAGGISGGVEGGCYISECYYNGTIEVTAAEQPKSVRFPKSGDKYSNYYSYFIGGIFANYREGIENVTVSNCYNMGVQSVTITEEHNTCSAWIYMGGITGSNNDRLVLENSYSAMKIVSSVPDENCGIVNNFVRNAVGGFTPDKSSGGYTLASAKNSFFIGTLNAANTGGGRIIGMWGMSGNGVEYVVKNCYYSDTCGYRKEGIPASSLLTSEFIIDTLGWNRNIWNITDGSLPTLENVGVIPLENERPANKSQAPK